MECYYCTAPAKGVCRFCGAGVCRDHVSSSRFVSGWQDLGHYAALGALERRYDVVVVENALWCGRCRIANPRTPNP